MKLAKCVLLAALLIEGNSIAPWASAADVVKDYPNRPIRWVVPQAPGGAADTLSRIVGAQLGDQWGKSVVIDNRPGANGIIGSDIVSKSAPNGYTWLTVYTGNLATNPSVYKRLPYDSQKDFRAIATMAVVPYLVVVTNTLPAKSLKELMALAKQNPKQLNYGAPTGSLNHLIAVTIQSMARVEMTHVPYKSAGAALTDTMAGQIQVSFATTAAAGQLTRSGKLRGVAISSKARSPLYPDIPTILESGFPDFRANVWFGILVPAATPQPLIRSINNTINKLLTKKETIDRFSAAGADVYASTPEEFEKIIRDDIIRWGDVVRSAGVTAE